MERIGDLMQLRRWRVEGPPESFTVVQGEEEDDEEEPHGAIEPDA